MTAQLLERERELSTLEALVSETAAGGSRVALVDGPAGIGKTQLLSEVRRLAGEHGIRVLGGRGSELEREFPFGVVGQLFEPVLVRAEERERLLSGAAAAARTVFATAAEGPEGPPVDASFSVLHGLYWLTVNLSAEGPLVLAVDDLHWCDRPSLRFLAYLARRLEGLPVLIACTVRSLEAPTDAALLSEIVDDPLTVGVHPRPLTEPAVGALVRERLGGEAEDVFARACHAATGGNPLLLRELLKALEAESVTPDAAHVDVVTTLGPRAASRAVLLRLGRLAPEAVSAARAAAILGEGADLVSIAALAGLEEADAARATAALVRAEILRPDPPLGFVHPLIAAAVYRDVAPGERELQHERAARLLSPAGAPPERVAAHLLAVPARGDEWVVETLRTAARVALQKGAPENAVSLLARALDEPPPAQERAALLLELGLAEVMTHGPAGTEHLREAYELLEDPVARGQVAGALGLALLQTGSGEQAAAVARDAAVALPPELADLRRGLEAFEIATAIFGVGTWEDLRRLHPHRKGPEAAGAGAKALTALASIEWAYTDGTAAEASELALASLAGGELLAVDNGFLSIGPIIALSAADREEATAAWEASRKAAHASGSLYAISSIHLWHGWTLIRRGELVEAEEDLAAAIEEFGTWGFGILANLYCRAFLATVLVERGDIARASALMSGASPPDMVADGVRYWLNARLDVLVAEGRFDEAVAVADELATRFVYVTNPAVGPWRSLAALALDGLGRRDEALALAEAEVGLARHWGAPWALGRSLRVLGTLRREQGLAELEEAVSVLTGSPARLELAKALGALGSALRRARRPSEAREPLRRALELADVCGATGLAEHVRSELYATGARPRTTALGGVQALTASEQRVAALAAEGQTNRDIAQALFVTPKTVEVHLSSAYRKLGIRSRRELSAALAV